MLPPDEQFLQDLVLPVNADMAAVEQKFVEKLKDHLQKVSETFDEDTFRQEQEWLRGFMTGFFQWSMRWAAAELQKKEAPNHKDAIKLKKQAREVIDALQKNLLEFALCYMNITRLTVLLRDEIKREEIRMGAVPRDVKWTSDAGAIIARYKKEKRQMLAQNERLKKARAILETMEPAFIGVRGYLIGLFGHEKAEPYIRSFTAALRMADFKKAQRVLKDVADSRTKFSLDPKTAAQHMEALLKTASDVINAVERHAQDLTGAENKLYLRAFETDMAYNGNVRELRKILGFLSKYHLPYMQYKLDSLSHLKDKLLVIGSFESLMTLYIRLITGFARPLTDIKAVRLYESEVLERVGYLMNGHFQEIPKLMDRAGETVQEFRAGRADYEELSGMTLEEIAVAENPDTAANA